ncbi:TetR/AcrR family transcriptional regulator [Clostridium chauvoei]|uniref:TetR/AcrR family transcriptional regulator n=3 Tax=Clostridium chauvoei TaxID=46867 RepID=A0ABD4RHS5_9CLOT|nr:TetR/AcrR family transcriptional regulator [Clostridium chauvoei]ATD55354.1 TetR family transcriptional regulator [Clostridium chauvoei]MBX7280866.1 TetR/AcrR family transcriptional regulator [Clostridium chauvoei]MBX7283349.1 TetR/AcrR family transcriptional regulator [Clostridium chauvoei]MBX7285823.1 TetR/AcrR family transcriptional regulator [Clostridium chauvoei]MBX7288353.1 TetR/AcrR family transcriptional regulator [Clostridium chauvoei]
MGKVEEKKRKKEEMLFNTAFNLFSTKGINNTAISDIVKSAGVGKGTFYLYFKDKYDIRDKLVTKKTGELFEKATIELKLNNINDFDKQVIFVIDYIIDQLNKDKLLLKMIARNLSWGIYKKALDKASEKNSYSYYDLFMENAKEKNIKFKNPEVLLFTIVEMVGSTCYNSILYEQPVPIKELKPHLYESILAILAAGRI